MRNEISKRSLDCFWPLPPLALLSAPPDHEPVELDGKDTVHSRNDVEQLQRTATAHITLKGICHSETSPIHLFKNNQWFETVQNYCLRSLLFIFARLLHQLRKSCKDLQLATPAFAQRDTYRKITQSVDSGLLWGVSKRALKRAARPFSKSRQKKHFDGWRHERYLSKHPLLSLNSRAMQSSLLDCLKSLSRSLMIHATVLSRPWPCS